MHLTANARQLRKDMTVAEKCLWRELRLRQAAGYKFRRQYPIGRYIADFACPERKLIVELDGGQHSEQMDYDATRTQWLESQGYRVLRFWNNEVLVNMESVKEVIFNALGENGQPPTPALPHIGGGSSGRPAPLVGEGVDGGDHRRV